MPMSVTMPVMWVVRISSRDSLEITAFCKPMMKHSSSTVSGTNKPCTRARRAPSRPKHSSNAASSSSGPAYSLCNWWRRAKLTISAEVAAPATNASSAPSPAATSTGLPNARSSAMAETMPVMCEVYCCTAKKPPALMAPATNASARPNWRLLAWLRWRPVRRRAKSSGNGCAGWATLRCGHRIVQQPCIQAASRCGVGAGLQAVGRLARGGHAPARASWVQ